MELMQVRLAAQELLGAELKNLGPNGRKCLVEAWSGYIPKYGDPPFQGQGNVGVGAANGAALTNGNNGAQNSHPNGGTNGSGGVQLVDEEEDER